MILPLIMCLIAVLFLMGSTLCCLAAINHRDDDQGNKYGFCGVGMMAGAIAAIVFALLGPNSGQ